MYKFYVLWKSWLKPYIVKYNQYILLVIVIALIGMLPLIIAILNTEKKLILTPRPESVTYNLSSAKLYPNNLKSWTKDIIKILFSVSPDKIEEHIHEIYKITLVKNKQIYFLQNYQHFIQKNMVQSVFDITNIQYSKKHIIVSGYQYLYFLNNEQVLMLDKNYVLSYSETKKGMILLVNIEEA